MNSIKTPAKLILSGEHAVVYGAPALAMSVNRFTNVKIEEYKSNKIFVDFKTLNFSLEFSVTDLVTFKKNIDEKYQDFSENKINIREVFSKPHFLALYTIASFFRMLNCDPKYGSKITIDSDIPIGRGLGSSAALIIGLLKAISEFHAVEISEKDFFNVARNIENLQHGQSSGLDLYLAMHGGAVLFNDGKFSPRPLPKIPFYLVDTGLPKNTTGECVLAVKKYFVQDAPKNTVFKNAVDGVYNKGGGWGLLNDFSGITLALDASITKNDLTGTRNCIRENHKLLKYIGVVPEKVANFISEIETRNFSGKICGAGAITGENGGIVLVIGDENINDLIVKYQYKIINNERVKE